MRQMTVYFQRLMVYKTDNAQSLADIRKELKKNLAENDKNW